ncbi:hypothetical protein [Erythrobacter mangrovi]|uniref:Uncharacterized protein n=1 Tax=Erythrobacter mangrovi TaxID=2739433 RepID=A0A7D4C4X1_9SPHN|nr:hypothetical protein [Erythrobacter mangrovi]QKG71665.1 hypothetical protein HQR01_09975 [Erythrobacter mangrovi]
MRGLLSLALVTFVALPTAASAQWTGSRIGSTAKRGNPSEVMQITAECVARRGPGYAFDLMESLPGSEDEFLIIRRNEGDIGNCMDSSDVAVGNWQLSFVARSFRRSLVREMVRVQLRRKVDTSLLASGESWFVEAVAAAPEGTRGDLAYLSYMDFGDCVVASAPQESIELAKSEPESTDERLAVQALVPFLSSCLGQGQELKLSTETLRLAVTEPLYHRIRRIELEN